MKRIRPTILILPGGMKIRLAFASCLRCRRLVGACANLGVSGAHVVWDSVGFTQSAKLQFADHECPPERRRDLARDAKLEASR